MRCVECGNQGHLKCTSFKRSSRVRVDFKIKTNIDSFFKQKKNKNHSDGFNVEESSRSQRSSSGDEDEGDNLQETLKVGCAGCGSSKHDVTECNDRRGNQKYQQFENVRAKFARDVGFNYK